MRMMGVDSVAYHRSTVLERGDDFPVQALAYYASRGESPLVWGGEGAARLGPWPGPSPRSSTRRSSGRVGPVIRCRGNGWCVPVGRGWSWSFPRTNRWPSSG